MESRKKLIILFALCTAFCLDQVACDINETQIYIVYMGELPEERNLLMDEHHRILSETIGDETMARKSKIYSYTRSFNGFAAQLLPHQAQLLSKKEGIVSVFPNRVLKPLTTRSWDFIGFPETVKRNTKLETNMIIAVLDSGIWVDSPSFNDTGFGPPPSKWKGKCYKGANFTGCNKKVIGAQGFYLGGSGSDLNPLDTDGHGTHTASIAGGVVVKGASLYDLAKGTARGAVPASRIASYKVCWAYKCHDTDILAAFDAAIADGVDVISVSLGGFSSSFFKDSISIGSFHAMKKGILTVCAAGNDGPFANTVQNVAPWIFTVAASTIDRKFEANVKLGNGEEIIGSAINTYALKKKLYSLTSGYKARNPNTDPSLGSSACLTGTMDPKKVEGKIVLCNSIGSDLVIQGLSGAGTIMVDEAKNDTAYPTITPSTYVGIDAAQSIAKYINSTRQPQAVIYQTRSVTTAAPAVAYFSSRGPQQLSANLLKPDIAAPGVDILAAYSKYTTLTGKPGDTRVVIYNLISGTSMATPHVSGAAAYIKSFRPHWSPATIKSALMTTSTKMKIEPLGAELSSGSGQINPIAALNPGLIYDMDIVSYISFLCKQGFKDKDIALFTESNNYNCSSVPRARGSDGLNYPSMHLLLQSSTSEFSGVFYRSVTNIGISNSTYKAMITTPKDLSIEVTPNVLQFNKLNQNKSFTVTVKGKATQGLVWYRSGSLLWTDSKNYVRSPILVTSIF